MTMGEEQLSEIIEGLEEIKQDSTVPKNIKIKIDEILETLRRKDLEISLKVDKVQQELEDISSDANLQPFTRTQLWNVVSLLETLVE